VSSAAEIMKAAGTRPATIGIDLTLGCLGTLAALNVAHGWLTVAGGGCAAIVTAERWAYTVDRSVTTTMTLWAHSDGAGALVVGLGTGDHALGVYQGAEFVSAPEMNGRVLIKYGGTRYPVAPPGVSAIEHALLVRIRLDHAAGRLSERGRGHHTRSLPDGGLPETH
jgi:3-oxoacyl-[acyl-carrier-protein] synthase III